MGVGTEDNFAASHAFCGNSGVRLQTNAKIGSRSSRSCTTDHLFAASQRNRGAGCPGKNLSAFGDGTDGWGQRKLRN
jgi:hypothetical protein